MKGFIKTISLIAAGLLLFGIMLCIVGGTLGGNLTGVQIRDGGVHVTDWRELEHNFANVWHGIRPNVNWDSMPTAPTPPTSFVEGTPDITSSATYYDANGEANTNADTYTATDAPQSTITALDFSLGAAKVSIQQGSEFTVSSQDSYPYTSTVKNGCWTVEMDDDRWHERDFSGQNSQITITIPADATFDSVSLELGAGKMDVSGIRTKRSSIEVGAGDMTITDFVCTGKAEFDIGMANLNFTGDLQERVFIQCGMGNVELHLDKLLQYGYEIEVGMGTVSVGGKRYSGIAESTANAGAKQFFDIECGLGAVLIDGAL